MSGFNSLVIDTNIFIRFFAYESEDSFVECKQLIDLAIRKVYRPVVTELILAEIIWVLGSYYAQPKHIVCSALEAIQHLPGILIIPQHDVSLALNLFRQKNVKYVDATIASIQQVHNGQWPVISYDTDYKKLPVTWLTPAAAIRRLTATSD